MSFKDIAGQERALGMLEGILAGDPPLRTQSTHPVATPLIENRFGRREYEVMAAGLRALEHDRGHIRLTAHR